MKKLTLNSVLYRRIPIALVVYLLVLIATLFIAPISKLFLAVAVGVGILHSLVSMEELTGGKGLSWLSLPLILITYVFANSVFFEGTSKAESWALMFQFIGVVFLTESLVIILFRSPLEAFMAQRKRR